VHKHSDNELFLQASEPTNILVQESVRWYSIRYGVCDGCMLPW